MSILYHSLEFMLMIIFIYNIRIYNWILPQDHSLVKLYNGSVTNLISAISVNSICQGVTRSKIDSLLRHFVPKVFIQSSLIPLHQTEFLRAHNRLVLCQSNQFSVCSNKEQQHERLQRK